VLTGRLSLALAATVEGGVNRLEDGTNSPSGVNVASSGRGTPAGVAAGKAKHQHSLAVSAALTERACSFGGLAASWVCAAHRLVLELVGGISVGMLAPGRSGSGRRCHWSRRGSPQGRATPPSLRGLSGRSSAELGAGRTPSTMSYQPPFRTPGAKVGGVRSRAG